MTIGATSGPRLDRSFPAAEQGADPLGATARLAILLARREPIYSRMPDRDAGLLRQLIHASSRDEILNIRVLDVADLFDEVTSSLHVWMRRGLTMGTVADMAGHVISKAVEDEIAAGAREPVPASLQMWRTWYKLRQKVQRLVDRLTVQDAGCFFWASNAGFRVSVGIAKEPELSPLAASAAVPETVDVLDEWCLVVIRRGTLTLAVHALGTVRGLGLPWISPPLAGLDRSRGLVWTSSGHTCRLGKPGAVELGPDLLPFLEWILISWGLSNVRG